jgi:hypothetical protein
MKISIFVICVSSLSFSLFAQQPDSTKVSARKITYFNNLLAGGLFGDSGGSNGFALSTTHGIRIKSFALGAGVGFDSYGRWETGSIFGVASYDFLKIKKNAFYLQFAAGHSNASKVETEEWWGDYKESGGPMINTMLGYRISARQFSLYIQAGHKYQEAHYSYNPQPWSSAQGSMSFVDEEINRVVFQIGFGFH